MLMRSFNINGFLLNEVSLKTLETEMSVIGYQDQYDELFEMKSELGNLKDPYFNMIILNTFKNDPTEIVNNGTEVFTSLYKEYAIHIQPFQHDRDKLIVKLNNGVIIDFNEKLDYSKKAEGNVTATYEDVVGFINVKLENRDMSKKKMQAKIDEELYYSMSDESNHFDFIYEDNNYIVFYPKTQFGSKIIARSMFVSEKLIYDSSAVTGNGSLTGKLNWCTSTSGEGNSFLAYKKGNTHMYYCLKKFSSIQEVLEFVKSDNEGYRKLCISFRKINDETSFAGGMTCVNGNNDARDEEWFRNTLGSLYNILFDDASSPKRLDFDQTGYFKSINLEFYKDLRKNVRSEEVNDFLNELQEILRHSHAKNEIAEIVLYDPEPQIRNTLKNSYIYDYLNSDLKIKIKQEFINNKNISESILKRYIRLMIN